MLKNVAVATSWSTSRLQLAIPLQQLRNVIRLNPDDDNNNEFQAMLAQHVAKCPRTDDYDRFISTENDGSIKSALAWWKMHHHEFPDLARMVRDTLAVPASGCSVERMFSVSGRVANWERSRLHDKTIGDIMMYKSALTLKDAVGELEECDELSVPEMVGKIPREWENDWWKKKLRCEIRPGIMSRFLEDTE